MKIRTPHYYKDFKCIAGACTDTCCAGWEVDVDEASYEYYKTVKGDFGERLKSVMVPSEEGGCTFTLNNGRCPFLNDKNLCDLFTALGEDKLCETCAEFPRFINEYGNVREIGIAPSCKTAGELIFNYKEKITFDVEDDCKPLTSYNDIDGNLYMQLLKARETAYEIVQNESFTVDECCMLLLEFAHRIQRHMDKENDHLIANVVKAFGDDDKLTNILEKCRQKYEKKNSGFDSISELFKELPDMEVINTDWYIYLERQKEFIKKCEAAAKEGSVQRKSAQKCGEGATAMENGTAVETYRACYKQFDESYTDAPFEYRQLLVYYVYRYFLDAVYDYDVLLKVKNGIIGYIILKHLDVAAMVHNGGTFTKTEQIDIAHLYSRQFEHSYTNFEKYSELFGTKRCYGVSQLMRFLQI